MLCNEIYLVLQHLLALLEILEILPWFKCSDRREQALDGAACTKDSVYLLA